MFVQSLRDAFQARSRLPGSAPNLPLRNWPELDQVIGAKVWIKHENLSPIRSFKWRGALTKIADLQTKGAKAVVTASAGNHGIAVAWAARQRGLAARVVLPEGSLPEKAARIAGQGAQVIFFGSDFEMAKAHAQSLAIDPWVMVDEADPLIVTGNSTLAVEMLLEVPDLDTLMIQAGSGALLCGISIAAKQINPDLRMVGVQAAGASALYQAWQVGHFLETGPCQTIADGLAQRIHSDAVIATTRQWVDQMVLVSDQQMRSAIGHLYRITGQAVEPSGAAGVAALLDGDWRDRRIGVVLTGGYLSDRLLAESLSGTLAGGAGA